MSETIRVRPTQDGTYTVYRGPLALVSGLTRQQAERYEASIGRLSSGSLAAGT
jgi:outer membrane usher protein FimD/PapC